MRAGAQGVGEVVESTKAGIGGKAGRLILAADYITDRGVRVRLQSLQMSVVGENKTMTANVAGLGGLAFAPLGLVGLAVRGGEVELPAGAIAQAKLANDVFLPSVGRATREMLAAATTAQHADTDAAADSAPPSIVIPPPPPGRGQVVFFRAHTLMGTGQWFNVRENGQALGKLFNGAYFIQVTEPGRHSYTAATELRDTLTLQVDPGETYYVEGTLTKGIVLGEANIAPSSPATFNNASKDLKLAPPPGADNSDDRLSDNSADPTNSTNSTDTAPPTATHPH